MKKFLLILFSLFVFPLIAMAYGDYYYDYSSKSYQCVRSTDQLEIIDGVIYCGGVHFISGGDYSCADPNAHPSGGSCFCNTGYDPNLSTGKCEENPNWTLSGATEAANRQNYAESMCDQSGGAWLSSMTCKCPTGCHQSSDGWCVADSEEMLGVCMGDGDGTFDSGSGGSGSTSTGGSISTGGTTVSGGGTVEGNPGTKIVVPPTKFDLSAIGATSTATNFADILAKLADWILNIALIIAPLIIIYGGYLHVSAVGEMAKVNKARNVILFASIGFIIALLAKGLVGIFVELVVK